MTVMIDRETNAGSGAGGIGAERAVSRSAILRLSVSYDSSAQPKMMPKTNTLK